MKITVNHPAPVTPPPLTFDVNMSSFELRYVRDLVGAKAPADVNSRYSIDNAAIYHAINTAWRSL